MKIRDLTGQKFGRLTVLRLVGRNNSGQCTWECKCDCTKVKILSSDHLTRKKIPVKSCGCLFKENCGANHLQWNGHGEIPGGWWYNHVTRSTPKRLSIKISITIKDAWELFLKQKRKCALSGMPITISNKKSRNTASIDRIDSSKGYIKGNIQWVHKDVNFMKRIYEQEYFIDMCNRIYSHTTESNRAYNLMRPAHKTNEKSLIGKRFGNLTVIRLAGRSRTRGCLWECRCDCNNLKVLSLVHLTQKTNPVRSCGCLVKLNRKDHREANGCGEISGTWWYNHILNSNNKRKGRIEIAITIKYAWELFLKQDRRCALSGVPLMIVCGGVSNVGVYNTASLDRIDSSKGYIEGNVQWVHKDVNFIKGIYEQRYFISTCGKIYKHNINLFKIIK